MTLPTSIDCQTCGRMMIEVTEPAMKQRIAANPENFIVDCSDCMRGLLLKEQEDDTQM